MTTGKFLVTWTQGIQVCNLLTVLGVVLALVIAVEELPVEQLDSHHGEDELEEGVDDEDVEHILEGDDHAVEDSLQLGDPIDGLQRSQDPQQLDGF